MLYKVMYFDEALADLKEAKTWYNKQQKGLGKRLNKAVRDTIDAIKLRPQVHSIRYRNIRIANVDVFPYAVHYYFSEEAGLIAITAIVHNSRRPGLAQGRTK